MRLPKKSLRWALVALVPLLFLGAVKVDYFEITKQIEIFNAVFREITTGYVEETQPGTLMENALKGLLNPLDPYTTFIPERDIENYRMMQTGQYGGIGATVRIVGEYVVLSAVHEGGPADKAGLHPGDLLLAADDVSLGTMDLEGVANILKGSPGSKIKCTYQHSGVEKTVVLTRAEIHMKAVPYYALIQPTIGYIVLTSFTETSYTEVRDALSDLQKQGATSLVLDLRSNPGGLVSSAVDIVNLFIPKGVIVVRTKGQLPESDHEYKTLREPMAPNLRIAVVIDGQSASASEIVAGALQDLDRGVIVGEKSFGKGLVQQTRPLAYGAQLKMTVAKYHTPSGRCIQAYDYHQGDVRVRKADSSHVFLTTKGRKVYEGGGIDPDVKAGDRSLSPVLYSLLVQGGLFDFARMYVAQHPAPSPPESFRLHPADYARFLSFVDNSNINLSSDVDETLNKVEKMLKEDGYAEELAPSLAQAKKALAAARRAQLIAHKEQIAFALEIEIIGLYGYERSQAAFAAFQSPSVLKALEVLAND